MRGTLRMTVAVGAGVLTVATLAGPAGAKGAVSVTITGPGIPLASPIELSAQTASDEWGQIDTGLWEALPDTGAMALTREPSEEHLGPRHTLTWQIITGPGDDITKDPYETTSIRQDLYLYADGGPLVYTSPGQAIWDGVTTGGWYRAPDRLRQVLADACVPIIGDFGASAVCAKRQMEAKAASARGTGRAVAAELPAGDPWWPEVIGGAAGVAVLAGLIGALAVRRVRRVRQRRRVAPIPL